MGVKRLLLSRGGGVLSIVTALVVGVIASIHPGVPTQDLTLNDGGVWVTNESLRLVAHLNYPSRTLDGGLTSSYTSFDISQNGKDVLVHDTTAGAVTPVDPALVSLGSPVDTAGLTVVQGGTTAALVDSGSGKVYASDTADVGSLSPDSSVPVIDGVEGAKVVVGTDGSVHAVSKTGLVKTVTRKGEGWSSPTTKQLSGITDNSQLSITSVGAETVVLDRSTSTLYLPSTTKQLDGLDQAVLQQPGPGASTVSLETTSALLKVTLRKGEASTVQTGASKAGTPVAPVVVNGCRYAAWGVTGQYVRDCDDAASNTTRTVDKLQTSKSLVFRTNRDAVVINDTSNGDVFIVSKDVTVVNNWDDVVAAIKSKEQKDDKQQQTTTEETNPDRTQNNQKPDAVDDQFGVRPGRSTTLPVLQNDTDPDGDVLTATPGKDPSVGTVRQVRNGAALQITVPDGTTGGGTFTYTANDGRGGTDDATVTVSVHAWDVNGAPDQWRASKAVSVVSGGTVAYNVSSDWNDPDGDQIFVSGATAPDGMTVKYRADGLVTVKDLGTNQPGRYDVKVTMSDGSKSTEGVLHVDVRAKGTYSPVANADFAKVIKGAEIVVSPLANDTDPTGSTLRLAKISDGPSGTTVTPNYDAGTFRFSSTVLGTFYLDYVVSNGPTASKGVVRIDVVDAETGTPPVADDDLALLPSGGEVMVDVLANDVDPTGGVLVIQSVDKGNSTAISVEVVKRAKIRVSAPGGLTSQTSFTYSVSNGYGTAKATVTVVPLPAVSSGLPPVASDDAAVVRAGDIVTVAVLDNDSSPAGLALTLDPNLQMEGTAGQAFVSEKTVRFKAGTEPGSARIVYTVRDTQSGYASAQVKITIKAADSGNTAPTAPPLVARVVAGGKVQIPVQLDGVDPDGDSVTLLGLDTAPSKGTVTVATTYMEYAAPAGSSGSDTFTYAIEDRYGARSIGTVKVGIAPPSATNQSPVAVADIINARPSRQLSISVLANDIDPDGDTLSLVPGSAKGSGEAASINLVTEGSQVQLTTPATPGLYSLTYQVTDGRGGTTTGQVSLTVKEDVPLQAPIARDDIVSGAELESKTAIDVDVLANDDDPDGDPQTLTVTTESPTATVKAKGVVNVQLTETRQVIVYTVTDVDGLTGKAAIVVPGTADRLPTLRQSKIPLVTKGGDTETINLADYVSVRDGHTPMLTFENRVKAGPGANGDALVKDAKTLVFTSLGEYSGSTSITFEVTDGTSADDPTGLKAVLTLPITVKSSGKTKPTFTATDIKVSSIETTTLKLKDMITDPDEGDMDRMKVKVDSVPDGFSVSVDSSLVLTASAPASTRVGTAGVVQLTITDGSTTPVTGQMPIKAVASSRALISATEAVITASNAGKAETVDISSYATNPFKDLGKPITMVGQPVVQLGEGTATAEGLVVTVTPALGFHGQLTVVYTLADATETVERQVQGKITLTVRDKPDAPTAVTGITNASRSATVSWQPGANNGAEISNYTVTWTAKGGGHHDCGKVTVCELTNLLANDVEYTFTVVATNEVGPSDPSAPSNTVRPDVKPNTPVAPTVVFGDKQLTVTWVTPSTEGSAVAGYTLEISGAVAGATQQQISTSTGTGGSNSYTWTGLTNGTSYTFRVQALAKEQLASEWSTYSSSDTKNSVPAGVPQNLVAPTVAKQPASALAPSATVTWAAPNGNGDNAMTYSLRRTGTTTVLYTGTAPTTQLTLSSETADYQFEYQAKNKAGDSAWSPVSAAIRAFQKPGNVTNLQVTATGTNNQVKVTFDAAPGNGALAAEITYLWQVNTRSGTVVSGGTITTDAYGLVNGSNYQIQIAARSTVKGESVTGDYVTSGTVTPYGPPHQPTNPSGLTKDENSVIFSWNATGAFNGRNLDHVDVEYRVNGGSSTTYADSLQASKILGGGRDQTWELRVRGIDIGGVAGDWSSWASAKTWPAPVKPYISATNGNTVTIRIIGMTNASDISDLRCWKALETNHQYGWDTSVSKGLAGFATSSSPGLRWTNVPDQTVTVTCPFAMSSSTSVELYPISWANP